MLFMLVELSITLHNRVYSIIGYIIHGIPADGKTSVPMIECKEFNKPENGNNKILHNKSVKSA